MSIRVRFALIIALTVMALASHYMAITFEAELNPTLPLFPIALTLLGFLASAMVGKYWAELED